jgi:ComF family protein
MVERPHFRSLRSWAEFDDPVKPALHKLKYRRDISLGDALAADMLSFVLDLRWPVDLIIPIPLGDKRRRERGYNQVAMIAHPLALAMKLGYDPLGLIRSKETRSQVGLTREERKENVQNAFAGGGNISGRTILVFDDVATTGSTLSSAADALLAAGAKDVYAVTVARALPHHGLTHA